MSKQLELGKDLYHHPASLAFAYMRLRRNIDGNLAKNIRWCTAREFSGDEDIVMVEECIIYVSRRQIQNGDLVETV